MAADLQTITTARQQLADLSVEKKELTTKQEQLTQRHQEAQAQKNRLDGEVASIKRQLAGVVLAELQEELQTLQVTIQKDEQQSTGFAGTGAGCKKATLRLVLL